MSAINVLLLSEQEVTELLRMDEVMDAVENAFREKALGYAQMPSKVYLDFAKYNGDVRAMPAYLERLDVAAVKIVNSHPDNPGKFGMPTVSATVLLLDPRNGAVLAIMGGTSLTAMRTAAAGGIAIKYLANKDAKIASFIGAGVQARAQLQALLLTRPNLEEIRVCDILPKAAEAFAAEAKNKAVNSRVVIARNEEEAVRGADIVITTTPSRKPVVFDAWVSRGTHLNCIGADAPLKEEIDPAILKRAKIVVDDWEQAAHSGEINVPISRGILSREDVWAELGEIVAGTKPGRTSREEITVFDSTGLAIQDAAAAEIVYRKALTKQVGCFIRI